MHQPCVQQHCPSCPGLRTCQVRHLAAIAARDWDPAGVDERTALVCLLLLDRVIDTVAGTAGWLLVVGFLEACAAWRGATAEAVRGELRRRLARALN